MTIQRREFVAGMLLGTGGAFGDAPAAGLPSNGINAGRLAWPPGAGYVSKNSDTADTTRWVQVDLGTSHVLDGVKLYPQFNTNGDHFNGEGFPVRFRIEASDDAELHSPSLLLDRTSADYADPADHIQHFPVRAKGRYVRLTVTKLRKRNGAEKPPAYYFSLAKLDVLSGGKDVAQGRPISDSIAGALGVTALTRAPRPQGEAHITDNPRNVIPASAWKRVSYKVQAPRKGVKLDGGPMATAFSNNIAYLLGSFSADELLKEFRDRAGKPNPPGLRKPDQFWQTDLAGSNAGRFLMGAGNAVRWSDHAELRRRLNQIVDGIAECRQPNGYIMAYPEDTIFESERAAYTRAWLTHGLIEAGYGGRTDAFQLLRGYYDWFDHCQYLPELLRGAVQGVQGMIGNTRMALTPAGKPKDIQVIQQYFQENYWLDQLAKREERAIWQYPYDRPHCYLITDLEAYLDIYTATGDRKYLNAVLGGWDLYHDKWQHVGGTISITEFGVYPPGSYRLHAETGELCGSVFFALLSQRFHFLFPEQEKYVNEIEKAIYNSALANQVGTDGIMYHANLVGKKDYKTGLHINTCCEGQGTRLLGAMPEFVYSIAPDGLYVNLYEASTIDWSHAGQALTLQLKSEFPFRPEVELRLSAAAPVPMKLRIRVPQWASKEMTILVNGTPAGNGKPGSFATLDRTWTDGDRIAFTLPMDFRLTPYTGIEKVAGHEQYAIEYGPILLALVGTETGAIDEKGNAALSIRPDELVKRLKPQDGFPLHFAIEGAARHQYIPYWQLTDQFFTCYPVMGA